MKAKKDDGKKIQSALRVTTSLDELNFLQGLLENLAERKKGSSFSREWVQADWEAIDTSSVEAYVSGDLKLSNEARRMLIPYITCFIFTCTKPAKTTYGLTWCSSLS